MKWYLHILPAVITVVGNIIFYLIIKGRIDNKIERYKTVFNGIFKEKIEVYRAFLKLSHSLSYKLYVYQTFLNDASPAEIRQAFNEMIEHFSINEPFISVTLVEKFKTLQKELQECFEAIFRYSSMLTNDPSNSGKYEAAYVEAKNKLQGSTLLKDLERSIISEMKKDLGIDKL
ncbi:hypothetical protein [Hufsiella ginkgonis]|uniref:5-bromo-4-chloroindolyl phosphate hydrolysis protein n=1 Tax=Hufsiella ginkgonis TaxID=2695274 RepID=A0A7K1Y0R9_9SPHI|nr:hypothetical protein [Hufsiella ginkgonis]MXV16840.1 hypothetical protein [Hufsiella ginkgonis]